MGWYQRRVHGVLCMFAVITMKVVAALVTIALHQATADWSGSGEFSCYGHVSTDVSSPEGGDHLGEGTLRCNIIEWGGGPLGPEAMLFKPNGGAEFEVWAWDYHDWDNEHWPMPYATCEGQSWYKSDDMGAGYCTPHKGFTGCGYGHCVGDIVCVGCRDFALQINPFFSYFL